MPKKAQRQAAIEKLVASHVVASQEELRRLLASRGIDVTQATLSRDLREMGLVRAPTDAGVRYVAREAPEGETTPSLASLLPQLFSSIEGVGELAVLRTLASGAQPISEAIDAESWPEVIGTIAGENTILVVCRSAQARKHVVSRISDLASRPE